MSSKAPAVIQSTEFAIMSPQANDFVALLEENLGGDQLSVNDLPRISVPTGETTMWAYPSAEGKPKMLEEVSGVLVYQHRHRAYWEKSVEQGGTGNPPDCSSHDGIVGFVRPESEAKDLGQGGECAKCPLAMFGSHPKGGGRQACKDMRRLFLVPKESMLPVIINLPPTSIKPFKQFMTALTSGFVPYHHVIVGLKLHIEKSSGGVRYPQVDVRQVERLEGASLEAFCAYREKILPFLRSIEVSNEDR